MLSESKICWPAGCLTALLCCAVLLMVASPARTQEKAGKAGSLTDLNLPDPLVIARGRRIVTSKDWEADQRPAILKKFESNIYGRMPGKPGGMYFRVRETDTKALDGVAIRKQIAVYFSEADTSASMNLILYLPKSPGPVPVFIGLNFGGNPSIDTDPAILPSRAELRRNGEVMPMIRGSEARRWPLKEIIGGGYGVATAYYQDLEPDEINGWQKGVRSKLQQELKIKPEEWGAIGAWAWGLSRIQDYLETDRDVDASKTIVTGHSRLGKAALWAGAQDKRFAIVVSNNSGEGGAALARRNVGESIKNLNDKFPYWFIEKYKAFNDHPEKLPIDQHMLLGLIAPRPIYVASASADSWADPEGEWLSLKNAEPVYGLYGLSFNGGNEQPAVNHSVGSKYMHYHLREGKHDILAFDWRQYIEFANSYFDR